MAEKPANSPDHGYWVLFCFGLATVFLGELVSDPFLSGQLLWVRAVAKALIIAAILLGGMAILRWMRRS
jgi:hypothetical protein